MPPDPHKKVCFLSISLFRKSPPPNKKSCIIHVTQYSYLSHLKKTEQVKKLCVISVFDWKWLLSYGRALLALTSGRERVSIDWKLEST